ncbi:hypothetical protein LXL04_017895 [Taraxacum kok-saghyz]
MENGLSCNESFIYVSIDTDVIKVGVIEFDEDYWFPFLFDTRKDFLEKEFSNNTEERQNREDASENNKQNDAEDGEIRPEEETGTQEKTTPPQNPEKTYTRQAPSIEMKSTDEQRTPAEDKTQAASDLPATARDPVGPELEYQQSHGETTPVQESMEEVVSPPRKIIAVTTNDNIHTPRTPVSRGPKSTQTFPLNHISSMTNLLEEDEDPATLPTQQTTTTEATVELLTDPIPPSTDTGAREPTETERTLEIGRKLGFQIESGDPILHEIMRESGEINIPQ